MAIKFIFTSTFSLIGSGILSAQTSAAWKAEQLGDVHTTNAVRQLEQNALFALIGAVVLIGFMWISSVWKACAGLNQSPQKANRHCITLFIFSALFLLANRSPLQAQTTNVWKGGFPGHESDWNQNRNWSLGKTPDVFDRVIIPDVSTSTLKYPVIKEGEIEVQSLEIRPGASLTLLRSARIVADVFVCNGACTGCEWRVLVEGAKTTTTVSQQ